MSQSRKKFKSRSRQGSSSVSNNKKNQGDSKEVLSKLDNLRSSTKAEHKKIDVDNSQRNKYAAFVIIVVIGMSGLIILTRPGVLPNTPSSSGTGPPKNMVNVGTTGFQKDLAGTFKSFNGMVTFVYEGGEFCPYCAMERWAMVMALEQFGNFTKLDNTLVSSEENIPTYTFVGSQYISNKVDFEPVELLDNNRQTLQTQSSLQKSLMDRYDASTTIPFLVIGGIYVKISAGSSLHYQDFKDKTWSYVNQQVTSKSGLLYQEIKAESDNLVTVINLALAQLSSATATTAITNTTTG